MDLQCRHEGNVSVARVLCGRLDARQANEFKQALGGLVRDGEALIALDLSEVGFIDSSGLGAIVSALKQLDGRGDLVIVGAQPAVRNLFRLTRMDKILRMFDESPEAVSALSG